MEKVKSKVFVVISILVMLMIIVVGTYALTVWTSKENTELTIRIGDIEGLTCLKENDINVTDIGPVFDYEEDGEITEFTVLNNTGNLTLMTGTLKINNITEDIQNEDFKYVVQYSEDKQSYENISEGNFDNVQNGDEIEIFKEKEIENKGFFKVIFYLDGNSENPIELQGGSLESELTFCTNTVLKVSATDVDLRLPGTKNVTYEYYGDGTLSCSSSDTSIVTCEVDTVNNRVVLTSVAEGTATVSLISTEGSYHAAVTKEMNITVDSGKYTIILNKNCGTASSMNIYAQDISGVYLDLEYSTKMTTTTNPVTPPTCTGYQFNGYYTDTTGGTQMLSSNGYITSNLDSFSYNDDVTFYGQWNPNTYNITYVMNDGTVDSSAPTSATYDTVINIKNPTRSDGYEFTGWTFDGDTTTAKHGSSESNVSTAWSSTSVSVTNEYFKNLSSTNNATVTMTANFKKELTATFKYYNNKTITKKCTIVNDETSCSVTVPTETELAANGYTLRGLSTNDAANATITLAANDTLTLDSDVEYYASYRKEQTATFYYSDLTVDNLVYSDPQVSTTATATKYMNYAGTNVHSNYTIPTVVTSSTGGGAAPNYKGVATSVNSATTITTPTTANTAFYAVYDENLTFYYYTGSAHTNTLMQRRMLSNGTNYVTSLSATEPTPASPYDEAPLKGWTYTPSVINNVTPLSTVENKLYSYWQKDVTLTYNSNGCGTAPSTQSTTKTYISNNEMVELTNTLTVTTGPANCAGQSFVEWNTASDGSGTSYDPGDTMTMDSSKTLYAIWDGPTYTITYDYDGGSVSSANPTTYNVSTATFTLNNPTYEHYLFNSWTEELSTSNWYSGFININSGAIETSNASYPNSVYSEMIYLESGVTYTISGTNLGGIRWRFYSKDGKYVGNESSTATYTPTQNGYVRVLLYEGCTEANRNAMKITSSQGATVQIVQGSTGNRKYIASKTERNYTIDFNCNNGTNPPSSVTKPYGTTVTLPTNTCTREGHSFLGWSVSHEATSATYGDGDSYTVNATATLYAVWEINKYTISYDANGGSGAPASQTKTYGTALTLSSTKPSRTGYAFANWNTAANGSGTSYAAGASYTANAAATLYAQWTINTYAIKYDCNGGTGTAPADQTKIYGTALNLQSNTCTREGYTFLGWSKTSTATTQTWNDKGTYTDNAPATLYAIWKIKTYTVSYDANGGSGAPASQTKTHGTALTLSSTKPTQTGYSFVNWNTKADGSGTSYAAGASYTTEASATLYAQWDKLKYSVTFNCNGGSGTAPASQTKTYGVSLTLNANTCTREGYSFLGWSKSSTATTQTWNDKGIYTDNAVATMYAVWKINTYQISYDANGGSGAPSAQTKTYGTALTLSSTKPTRTGYTFVNWNTAADGSGTSYAAGASYTTEAAATLYAQWQDTTAPTAPTYTAFYKDGSGNYTSGTWTNKQVNTTLTSTDAGTGVAYMQYREGTSGSWNTFGFSEGALSGNGTTYTGTEPWGLRTRNQTYYFRACDYGEDGTKSPFTTNTSTTSDDNCSGVSTSYNIRYDITAPSSISYKAYYADGSGTYTSGDMAFSTVYTDISAVDAESGVTEIQYQKNGGTWTKLNLAVSDGITQSGTIYSGTESWSYSVGRNDNIYFRACDAMSNCSSASSLYNIVYGTAYTINYNANGGSGAPSAQTKTYGTALTLSSTKPTRTGYSFVNWNTKADGSGTSYAAGASYTTEATATLYAQWEDTTAPTTPTVETIYDIHGSRTEVLSSSITNSGNAYTTTGTDPYIRFDNIDIISGITGAYVGLSSGAPASTAMQIFYENSSTGYNETHSEKNKTLAKSATQLYVPFSYSGEWSKVRYDFGSTSGLTFNVANLGVIATEGQWNRDDILFRLTTTEAGSGVSYWQYKYSGTGSVWTMFSNSNANTFITSAFTNNTNDTTSSIYFRACDASENCSEESNEISLKVDKSAPTVRIIGASNAATLTHSDSVSDVESYYFGTSDPSSTSVTYTSVSNSNNISKTISAAGTYYFVSKDLAGNVNSTSLQYYSVAYNCNGGTGTAPATQYKANGVTLKLQSNTCSKSGYTFKGWATNASATTSTHSAGGNYTTNANATMYAVWERKTYEITYSYNFSPTFSTEFADTDYLDTGYAVNWDKDFTIESKIYLYESGKRYLIVGNYGNSDTKALNIEITTANALRVYFGTGQVNKSSGTVAASENVTITFTWDASANTYTITATGTTTNITFSGTYDMSGTSATTLRAGTVDNRGSTGTFSTISMSGLRITDVQNSNDAVNPIPSATRAGYTLYGWYTESGGGTQITSSTKVTSAATYYAYWSINQVKIQFSTNGGQIQEQTTASDGTVYTWDDGNDGSVYGNYIISRSTNGVNFTSTLHTINYGSSLGSSGLANWDNTAYMNISLEGHKAKSGEEWVCLEGPCATFGNVIETVVDGTTMYVCEDFEDSPFYTYDEALYICYKSGTTYSDSTAYAASDFCDLTDSSCEVLLGVNWTPDTYTVSYNANGGSGAPSAQTKTYGTALTLSSTKPTRTGYTFAGWNTASDGSGTTYKAGASYTANAAATLYAQWTANTYTITYYLGNASSTAGSTSKGTSTCTYKSSCTLSTFSALGATFPNSTNKWSFAGWNTSQTGTSVTYNDGASFTYNTAGNMSLYAVGSRTFKFYSGIAPTSATGSDTQYWNPYQTGTTYVTSITVPTATAISGWSSYGWRGNTTASSTRTINSTVTTYKPEPTNLTSVNFSAIYSRTATLAYNANSGGGTTSSTTGTQYYNSGNVSSGANNGANVSTVSLTVASNNFSRTGYNFKNWNTVSGGTGTSYAAGDTYSFSNGVSASSSVTLYAQWQKITYPVSYNCNGGSGTAPASQTKTYGVTLTLQSNTCSKIGYLFKGWSKSSTATSATWNAGGSYTDNASATLYAVWEKTNASGSIIDLAVADACSSNKTGICATNSYTASDGSTKYHDYRYRGAEPNNWVSFNNDMYRIIGVFDENSHGVSGQYLVKLISENPITSNGWGTYNTSNTSGTYSSYKNDWTGGTTGVKTVANVLMNEYYYNKTSTSSTYGDCAKWSYFMRGNSDYTTKSCSKLVVYGLDSTYRNYIQSATWYLKGYNSNEYSKQNFYLCERGQSTDTTNCKSGNSGAYAASTIANIGLMYVSDYLYASSFYSSTSTTIANSTYYGNQNWLYKSHEWTITPVSNTDIKVFSIYRYATIVAAESALAYNIRPTFYLKSTVRITGGAGTFDNPYTLSM